MCGLWISADYKFDICQQDDDVIKMAGRVLLGGL